MYDHFTHVYQILWLDDVRFLGYGARQTDRQTDIRTEKVTQRGGCPPKNKTKEKYQNDKSMQGWSEKRVQDNKNHEEKTDTEV